MPVRPSRTEFAVGHPVLSVAVTPIYTPNAVRTVAATAPTIAGALTGVGQIPTIATGPSPEGPTHPIRVVGLGDIPKTGDVLCCDCTNLSDSCELPPRWWTAGNASGQGLSTVNASPCLCRSPYSTTKSSGLLILSCKNGSPIGFSTAARQSCQPCFYSSRN